MNAKENRPCRWGILGTAGIARKNWHAIQLAENASLAAVASRAVEGAQKFIAECQAERPFENCPDAVGGYDTLLSREDVDAVYVPLPTGMRKEWVIKAAEAGKHVLGEKPCAVSASELKEMLAACEANNVQYMDGVMFMHSARLPEVIRAINDGSSVGKIRRITSHHTFNADDDFLANNIRLNSSLEPQGALGDLGWYSIRMFLALLDGQLPKQVIGRTLTSTKRADSPGEVPLEFSAELIYEDLSASLYCSFITENQQWVNVGGTKGFLQVYDFVLPFFGCEVGFDVVNANFDIQGCQFNMEKRLTSHRIAEYTNNHETAQETKLFEKFSELALSGKVDNAWPELATKTQLIMDACLESANKGSSVIELS